MKGRDTSTQSLLAITLEITQAFKKYQDTIAAFVDLEGDFDAVCRNAVLFKLNNIGIKGCLFMYIVDFLEGRVSRSFINSHKTDWVPTSTGVSQGSITAPLLFITFISDMSSGLGLHSKYADDISLLCSNTDTNAAANELTGGLNQVHKWSLKWRLLINVPKTAAICFTKKSHKTVNVKMNNREIQQVKEKRVLGVVLDENLNYKSHIQLSAAKAKSALGKLAFSPKNAKAPI